MADISYITSVTLPSGNSYYFEDEYARDLIKELHNFTRYLGITTTALTDGSSTNPITIGGTSVTAQSGDVATTSSDHTEFIFNGTIWQAFGDLSALGALAYKNSASGSGTVTVPKTYSASLTGTGVRLKTDSEVVTGVTGASSSMTGSFTPAGTVSQPTFTGTGVRLKTDSEVVTGVTVASSSMSGTFTPSGSISVGTGTANYTPAGSVSVSSAGATTSFDNLSVSVTGESLIFSKATKTVKTGDASYSFSGTGKELKFTGTQGNVSVSGTPSVTPTKATVTVSPASSGTATYTPGGTVSQPSFSGTAGTVSVSGTPSVTPTKATVTVSPASSGTATYTPAGTVTVSTNTTETKTVNVTVS